MSGRSRRAAMMQRACRGDLVGVCGGGRTGIPCAARTADVLGPTAANDRQSLRRKLCRIGDTAGWLW